MATNTSGIFDPDIKKILAKEIQLAVQPNFIWKKFVEIKEDITNQPGNKIIFYRIADISGGGQVGEEDFIDTQKMSMSRVEVEVVEFGNSIEYTRFASKSSYLDLYETVKKLLARNYLEVVESYLRDVYYTIPNVFYHNNTFTGASDITGVSQPFNVNLIRNMLVHLKEDLIPPFTINGQQYYICILHPRQMNTLRNDPAWTNAMYYGSPNVILEGSTGLFEGVIFIESSLVKTFDTGTYANRFGALFLGSEQVGLAIGSNLEIIEDPPQDLQRFLRIGWYQIMGAKVINEHGYVAWTQQ